jgi:hypothetical protein
MKAGIMDKILTVKLKKERPFPEAPFHRIAVEVTTTDNPEKQTIFTYYPDEISFTQNELIGLTISEAQQLKMQKDIEYLQT